MDTSENAGEWLRDKIRQNSVEAPAQRTAFDAMGDVSEKQPRSSLITADITMVVGMSQKLP
ncbi:hypothetical protein ColTof4_13429 [Colletotrichum tofieldiae]|nr:hypothetical protein ColTof3_00496 [Colletotrichum tofieldiae]GKT81006.1 hypothetical protein ColTof4_13429 [Colletotrichum tofieldiae]GKT88442.1 hypothetical protein Ct61P_06292 [Colletotrichum tofieldiae]